MRNGDIQNMVELSKIVKDFINNCKTPDTRTRKTSIVDGIAFRLSYSQKDSSQDKTTFTLNNFTDRITNSSKVSRQCYVEREDNIDISIYSALYKLINDYCDTHFYKKKETQIFAVDGTHTLLSKNLTKDGLHTTKNDEIIDGLVLGVYNITYDYPVTLDLVNDKNERKAYTDFIKNTEAYTGSIFIFDRGFIDNKLFKLLDDKGIQYICRLRGNTKGIDPEVNDTIINGPNNVIMRVVSYNINDSRYHLATNIFDKQEFTIQILSDLYHKRWKIEEYFKYLKSNTNFDKMLEKDKISIMKTIYAQLIVTRIVNILALIKGHHKKNKSMIVNKTLLTYAVYNNFLLKFIYNKHCNKKTIRDFLEISAIYTHSQGGSDKSYERKSSRPYTKWYIKKFIKKYMALDENQERVRQLGNERVKKSIKKRQDKEAEGDNNIQFVT